VFLFVNILKVELEVRRSFDVNALGK